METQNMMLIGMGVIIVALVVLMIRSFSAKNEGGAELSAQLIDLKNQVVELKTKQLEAQNEALNSQQAHLGGMMKTVNDLLSSTQKNITEQLGNTGKVVGDINRKLGTLEETARNIQEIGNDISSLQDILTAPKLRGNLGEYLLEELLKQILPGQNYEMQHSFKNGTRVDAIIRLGDGIVPVDSKFPLESFQRLVDAKSDEEQKKFRKEFVASVKARIDEVAAKYIIQDEGTYDFALMYIPAENVFYETVINDSFTGKDYEIFNYAIAKHVIPVSPNSFYSYLMALAYGLKGFRIEQRAKEIIGDLGKVQEMFGKFNETYTKVGKHLKNASDSYESSQKQAGRLNDRIAQVTGVSTELIGSDD